MPKYARPHTSVLCSNSFFAISLQHVPVINVYSSMDAAIILYTMVSNCCLSVYLNIFLLTTGLRKMVLGSWKSPGFFLTKSKNPVCYTSRIQSYKERSKVVINVTHERTSSILPICIHQRLQISKKRMYFRNCYT